MTQPRNFDASDPADPAYRWTSFDRQVDLAVASGLQPIISIYNAPLWAQGTPPTLATIPPWIGGYRDNFLGNWQINADELSSFARATARRYSGGFQGHPRVRYWQVWNEPNLSVFLNPQLQTQLTDKPTYPFRPNDIVSADLYRAMVNAVSSSVHAVHSDNVVIAGGVSPFSGTRGVVAIGPLLFMRKVLCMSGNPAPKPTCRASASFDVWSVHPYTAGGPSHSAALPEDVSLGDLPEVARLLQAAVRAGHVHSRSQVKLWVTEFGWDTTPPDPDAVPLRLHARWVAEGLHRMWEAGVSLATWYGLRDQALDGRPPGQVIQSGLYFRASTLRGDRPKPALAAFRFPFVAFSAARGIHVWGRTPWGMPGTVTLEQSSLAGWKKVASLSTDRYGIFDRVVVSSRPGRWLRVQLLGSRSTSVPFSLTKPAELAVNPFGGGPPACNVCP
jgi:hypothetical protein